MTDPDKLPALPEPDVTALSRFYSDGGSEQNMAFTHDQMRSYALTAIATERARADALQAENSELKAELKTVYQHHADEEARADALEAALKLAARWRYLHLRSNAWLLTANEAKEFDHLGDVWAEVNRALLEKKT